MRHPLPSAASARLGQRIRTARIKCGLRQYELADAMGVARSQVSAWEAAGKNPSLGSLLLLCRALEVAPGVLLDGLERL